MTEGAPVLPGILGELQRGGFMGAALTLAREWGGTRRRIPKRPAPGMALVDLIGLDAASLLASLYGDEEIDIPLGAQPGRKKAAILRHTGTAREVARAVNTTERHVRRVRNAGRVIDEDQGSLF